MMNRKVQGVRNRYKKGRDIPRHRDGSTGPHLQGGRIRKWLNVRVTGGGGRRRSLGTDDAGERRSIGTDS